MGKDRKDLSSFLKVLCCDFTNKLQLPQICFMKEFEGKFSTKKVVLKTKHPEEIWVVHMEKAKNDYFFGNGWKEFAKDHSLETGDILVFLSIDDNIFEVLIYQKNGCAKVFDIKGGKSMKTSSSTRKSMKRPRENDKPKKNLCVEESDTNSEENENEKPDSSEEEKSADLHFNWVLKAYNRCQLFVPAYFGKKVEIISKRKMYLKDPKDRVWKVRVADSRCMFTCGWVDFVRANKLAVGDECSFQFVKDKMINVKFVRNGGRQLAP